MNNDRLYCFLYLSFRQPHFLPGFVVRPAAVCFQNLFFLLHFHFADFRRCFLLCFQIRSLFIFLLFIYRAELFRQSKCKFGSFCAVALCQNFSAVHFNHKLNNIKS